MSRPSAVLKYLRKIRPKFTEKMSSQYRRLVTDWGGPSEIQGMPNPRNTGLISRLRFGRVFVGSFPSILVGKRKTILLQIVPSTHESIVSISVSFSNDPAKQFEAKLGFSKEAVFIETFQGPSPAVEISGRKLVTDLNQQLGMPWPNFLLRKIESHAKRLGFKQTIIHDPSTSGFFRSPLIDSISPQTTSTVGSRIQLLKDRISSGKPLVLTKRELSALRERKPLRRYLKAGRLILPVDDLRWVTIGSILRQTLERKKIQDRIKTFIGRIAEANDYVKRKNIFVKEL